MTMPVKTAVNFPGFRFMPLEMIRPLVGTLEEAGVDYFWSWDVLAGWVPQSFWKPEILPISGLMPDPDSLYDVRVVMGMVAESASSIGALVGMNTMRHGPAEQLQTMLTLSNAMHGNALFTVGSGEAYNYAPFGYSRGLARYEDHLRLYRLLLDCDGPIDFAGKVWNYKDAYIGTIRNDPPEIWALGGGPRLTDLGARYADGFMTCIPWGVPRPEIFAEKVKVIKEKVESHGRDPEKFGFGVVAMTMVDDDPDMIDKALEFPVTRYFTALMGRLNQADWKADGFVAAFPEDWHYSLQYVPSRVPEGDLKVSEAVSRAMVESSFICGSPTEVAASLQGYVEAGATVICPLDYLMLAAPPDDPFRSLQMTMEVCSHVAARNR